MDSTNNNIEDEEEEDDQKDNEDKDEDENVNNDWCHGKLKFVHHPDDKLRNK